VSFRVLVIPEDPTNNGYVLKPLVERMLAETGKPNARVMILTNPRLNGYDTAVAAIEGELVERYRHFNLWLFMPDADKASNPALDRLERTVEDKGVCLRCCAARPEVEAWLLAGHHQHLKIRWREVAAHPSLKEEIFDPFLRDHGDPRSAGGGRQALMRITLSNYRSLLDLCPELQQLEERLRQLPG
jgi:hypothetical protein